MLTRRRIVILTEDSKPALGGIAEYLHQLALAVSATHDVLIVSCVPGASDVAAPAGVVYRELHWHRTTRRLAGDTVPVLRRANTVRSQLTARRRLRQALAAIAAEHPDSTYVLGRLSAVTHPWCDACRQLKLPYLAFGYGLELIEPIDSRGALHRRIDVLATRHWFPISRDTRDGLASIGVPLRRQTLLTPGVDLRSVSSPDQVARRATRERLGLGDAPFLFTICMLRARKGVDLAIRALAAVAGEYPTLRYVVAGVGPEQAALRRLADDLGVGDRVAFVGKVDDATRNALLAECVAFVMPNRRLVADVEGFGIVFLEAALHGKAAIGGNNGGVPDAIVDGETGLLVDTSRGPDDVARAMRCLLGEPERARGMGEQGRDRALTDFSWAERARIFTSTVDEVAHRRWRAGTPMSNSPIVDQTRHVTGRVRATVEVVRALVSQGRVGSVVRRGPPPADLDACVPQLILWSGRAFGAGGGSGASASYNLARGWALPYPEITGYFIPTLLAHGDTERARRAGSWLAATRLSTGAICRKQWYPGNTTPSVFNTGQVIDGWCALAAHTGEPAWRNLARDAAEWLMTIQESDGSWIRWTYNDLPQAYYTRVAGPMARLGTLLGDARIADAARRNAEWATRLQQADGWVHRAGFAEGESPTTHTIGYVIDGWLTTGLLLNVPRFIEAADLTASALRRSFEQAGYLSGRYASGWRRAARWRCVTGDAQVGAVWCALARATGDARYRTAAMRIADQVRRTIEIRDDWPDISGAVPGSWPRWGDYDRYAYPTHAAKFTLDLLAELAL